MNKLLRCGLAVALLAFLGVSSAFAQADISLTPFTDDAFGFSSVAPDGWTQLAPGALARGQSPTDVVRLLQQVAPVSEETILSSLTTQLGLEAAPESVGTQQTAALTWTLYKVDVNAGSTTIVVDFAVAQGDGKAYLVLLQASPEEYESLHASVFLPVLDALAPLAPAAETTEEVPYTQEEVTFLNGEISLTGTLTLPEGDGPYPAVVLVSGSGPQDRDESIPSIAAIKPFRLIADALTRAGVAVLRYDDRGVGQSTGDFSSATTADFATDASAAIDYLLTREDINLEQVGLLGHSEGGAVAAMLAASHPNLAFAISMAGMGLTGREISLFQNAHSLDLQGITGEAKDAILSAVGEAFDRILADDPEGAQQIIHDSMLAYFQSLPEDQQEQMGGAEAAAQQAASQQVAAFSSDWFKFYLSYDPAVDWAQTEIPVLVIFGGLDTQVDADLTAPAVEAALQAAGNTDYTIVTLPEANHLMQEAVTGDVSEYGTLKQEFAPDFLTTLTDWVMKHVDPAQ